VQIGEHCDRDHAGDGVRRDPAEHLETNEPRLHLVGQPMFAVHPQPKAGDGNADLGGRDVAILPSRIFEDGEYARRQAAALRRLMLDARTRRSDDGEFCRDEQAVRQDEQHDDSNRDEDLHHRRFSDATGTTRLATTDCGMRSLTRSTWNS
jgi:hypothetical protein